MKAPPKGKGKGKGTAAFPRPKMVKKKNAKIGSSQGLDSCVIGESPHQRCSDLLQSREIRNFLQRKFSWDFNVKNFSAESRHKLAAIRAGVWWRLFSSSTRTKRWEELKQAQVSIEALRNIKHHVCPLGFKSREQLGSMMYDLSKAIPHSWGHHKIVISGSATTFYSENPDKTNTTGDFHWFDKLKKGDYDLSISFDNLSKPRAALGPPSTAEWGAYWGSTAVTNVLDLRLFYAKWGFHPFNKYPKAHTLLNRDIGVVILNYPYEESGTFCKFWKKDYVWDSSSKAFITPTYGVWNPENGGKPFVTLKRVAPKKPGGGRKGKKGKRKGGKKRK